MGKVQQYKRGISAFISSENGQRFFNFAYSIGAAIVIWGALFKILHLPGGNTLLSIGMGTEVLMFVLTAFDRPPREYHWEDVFPALRKESDDEEGDEAQGPVIIGGGTIYRAIWEKADKLYLTRVHTAPTGDISIPEVKASEWQEISREAHPADEKNEYDYTFLEYRRIRSSLRSTVMVKI